MTTDPAKDTEPTKIVNAVATSTNQPTASPDPSDTATMTSSSSSATSAAAPPPSAPIAVAAGEHEDGHDVTLIDTPPRFDDFETAP